MLQWSLSGHQHVCISNSREAITQANKGNLKWKTFTTFQILNQQSVLGLNSKDMKSIGDKANISNPKVNRGCAPLTVNRITADCVQISLGPSIPYIPQGVYHTGEFNAMLSALFQLHLHSSLNPWCQITGHGQLQNRNKKISIGIGCVLYLRFYDISIP